MHGYLAVSSRRRSPARPSTPLATPCSSRARWTYATSAPWPCQCCDSTTLLPARGIPAACGCTPCMWRRMSPRTLWPASTRWIPPCRTRWGSLPPACLGERSHPAFAQSIQRLWMHSTWYLTTNNPSQEHEINILHFTRSQIAVYCCIVLCTFRASGGLLAWLVLRAGDALNKAILAQAFGVICRQVHEGASGNDRNSIVLCLNILHDVGCAQLHFLRERGKSVKHFIFHFFRIIKKCHKLWIENLLVEREWRRSQHSSHCCVVTHLSLTRPALRPQRTGWGPCSAWSPLSIACKKSAF